MTENPYSKRIRKLIELWGEKNKDNFSFSITKIITKNRSLPIRINSKKIIYKPDAIYTIDYKDKIIFEILDSQIKVKTIAESHKILECLGDSKEPLTPNQMAKKTNIANSNISTKLKELRDRKFVECVNPADKKWRFYKITDTGVSVLKEVEKVK